MKKKFSLKFMLLVLFMLVLTACGGSGGGSGGGGGGGGGSNTCIDVSGSWNTTENVNASVCGDGYYTEYHSYDVVQVGCSLQVTSDGGQTFTGTVNGSTVSWTGSYYDAGSSGTVTITSMSLAFSGNSFSGNSNWNWSNGSSSCSGTTSVSGTRTVSASIPNAPSGLLAVASSSSVINLSWTDNSSDESGFKVERSSTSATTGFSTIATLGANTTSYPSTGLTASTQYWYRVRAYNGAGNSTYSNTDTATTSAPAVTLPTAPTGLSASATADSVIYLSWTDNSSDESGFKVERSSTSATTGFSLIGTVGANATNYTSSGLTASTQYWYRVRAYNGAGNSSYSNTATATTLATAAAPSLSGPSTSTGSITLTWTYAFAGLASTADGYLLQESTTSATSGFLSIMNTSNRTTADRTSPKSYTITRSPGTYYYRVRAYDDPPYGWTPYSNVVTVTVTSGVKTLRVINDLDDGVYGTNDWGQMNTILRVRIATTENAVITDATNTYERLWPSDSTCNVSNLEAIEPNYNLTTSYQDFDVNSMPSNYYVYIQTGWWDYDAYTYCWNKHMSIVVGCNGGNAYKWTTIYVSNHTSGTVTILASDFLPQGNWYLSSFCP